MKPASVYLIAGFGIAARRPHYILIDMIGKGVWLFGAGVIFWTAGLWFASTVPVSDADVVWFQTGIPVASLIGILRTVVDNWPRLGQSLIGGACACLLLWTLIEAFVRGGLLRLTGNSVFRDAFGHFPRFVLTGLTRRFILMTAGILTGLVSLGPLLTTPMAEWSSVWPDVGSPVIAGSILIASLAFSLTIPDTLVRCDAVELFGRALPEVLVVIGFPAALEMLAWALGVGLLAIAVTTQATPGVLLVLTGLLVIGLSIVHSYLLLARYSAVGIMQDDS